MPRIGFPVLAMLAVALAGCADMDSRWAPKPVDFAALQKNAAIVGETSKLNHLTRISIDASTLYAQAATEAGDAQLKSELGRLAANHSSFAQDLQQRVSALGSEPATTGEPDGGVHASFINLSGTADRDSVVAANELLRGESYLIDEIGKTLATDLTPVSKQMVEAELAEITADRTRLEVLQARIEAADRVRRDAEDAAADAFHDDG